MGAGNINNEVIGVKAKLADCSGNVEHSASLRIEDRATRTGAEYNP